LTFASDKQKLALHETQKPYALVEYFIKTYTNEGDTVLDPCRGSNTTGVVCDVLNRGYIGIEADEVHYKKGLIRRENPKLLGKDLLKLL
jgi:site-specific DNA-methyltransferase (adenine-specific)